MRLNLCFYLHLFTFGVLNLDLKKNSYLWFKDSNFIAKNFWCMLKSLNDKGTVTG